jgi:hypothetical protein
LFKKLPLFINFLIKKVKVDNFGKIMNLVKYCREKQPDRTEKKDMVFKEKFQGQQQAREKWDKVKKHQDMYDYFKFLNTNQIFSLPKDIPITNAMVKSRTIINASQSNANTQLHSETKDKTLDQEFGVLTDNEVNTERAMHVLDHTEIKGSEVDIDLEKENSEGDTGYDLKSSEHGSPEFKGRGMFAKGRKSSKNVKVLNTDERKIAKKTFIEN